MNLLTCVPTRTGLRMCKIRKIEAGPVAQWLEQQTHNLLVLGSSPSGPTRASLGLTNLVLSGRAIYLRYNHEWGAAMRLSQHVVPNRNGGWAVRRSGASRASRVFPTRWAAVQYARKIVRKAGGELYVHRDDGTVRDRENAGTILSVTKH